MACRCMRIGWRKSLKGQRLWKERRRKKPKGSSWSVSAVKLAHKWMGSFSSLQWVSQILLRNPEQQFSALILRLSGSKLIGGVALPSSSGIGALQREARGYQWIYNIQEALLLVWEGCDREQPDPRRTESHQQTPFILCIILLTFSMPKKVLSSTAFWDIPCLVIQ